MASSVQNAYEIKKYLQYKATYSVYTFIFLDASLTHFSVLTFILRGIGALSVSKKKATYDDAGDVLLLQ